MCSTPKTPQVDETPPEVIATPTQADAEVTKAGATKRNKVASLQNRNIKTAARGLADEATTDKKSLLGE